MTATWTVNERDRVGAAEELLVSTRRRGRHPAPASTTLI